MKKESPDSPALPVRCDRKIHLGEVRLLVQDVPANSDDLLGSDFPGNRSNCHNMLVIDIAHGLDVSMRECLHSGKETVINVFRGKRIEKLLKRSLIGRLDWTEKKRLVWRKHLVCFPLARVEGFVNGRKDLVFVDIMDAFGLSEQLLAESRMGNVDKGQRTLADGLAMQIGDSKFRNDITHGTAWTDYACPVCQMAHNS